MGGTLELKDGIGICEDDYSKKNTFSLYFMGMHRKDSGQQMETGGTMVSENLMTEEDALKIMEGLNASKLAGPDSIHKPLGSVCKLYGSTSDHGLPSSNLKVVAVVAVQKGGSGA